MAKNPAMPVLISGTVEQLGFRLCSWECDLIQPLWEIWQCPLKGGTFTTNSPEIPGLGLCQCKCTPVSWDVSKGVHSAWWAHDRKYHYSGYTAVPRHRSVFETQTWYWRENQTHKEILYSSSCLSLPCCGCCEAGGQACRPCSVSPPGCWVRQWCIASACLWLVCSLYIYYTAVKIIIKISHLLGPLIHSLALLSSFLPRKLFIFLMSNFEII